MKDLPTRLPDGLTIGAMLPRADPRDVLIALETTAISALPAEALIGTASLRRKAQLLALRPDLRIVVLRGNVQTRLRKLGEGEVHATLLARAGLDRLGLSGLDGALTLESEVMLPAVAQGAIGIECRADDAAILDLLAGIADAPTMHCVACERALLDQLDGSCRTPIAALAELDADALRLRALVATPDGTALWRTERAGGVVDAEVLGAEAGRELRRRGGAALEAVLGATA
jgi:hydroxymethylbilane synthase